MCNPANGRGRQTLSGVMIHWIKLKLTFYLALIMCILVCFAICFSSVSFNSVYYAIGHGAQQVIKSWWPSAYIWDSGRKMYIWAFGTTAMKNSMQKD